MHSVVRRGLGQALEWNLVARNVADGVKRPRLERQERTPFDAQQVDKLLKAGASDSLHALFHVAVFTGLRLGEVLALTWKDIDFEDATLTVRQTLTKVGERFEIGTPRTNTSKRSLDLSPTVVAELKKQRREQAEKRLVLGEAWATDLVFTTTIGTALSPPNVRRSLRRLLKVAGLPPIRFHDLRHTAATLMLSQGITPRVVMDVLGHSDTRMTMGLYAHVLKGQKKAAADAMEALMKSVSSN